MLNGFHINILILAGTCTVHLRIRSETHNVTRLVRRFAISRIMHLKATIKDFKIIKLVKGFQKTTLNKHIISNGQNL
jgi:hypothetical protein